MQVGTTKDQVLYHKRSAAVHPGALTAGTVPQYNAYLGKGNSDGLLPDNDIRYELT